MVIIFYFIKINGVNATFKFSLVFFKHSTNGRGTFEIFKKLKDINTTF